MTRLSEWIFGKAINRDTRHQLRAIRKQGMSDVEHSAKLVGIEMAIADIERRRAHQAEAERDTALAREAAIIELLGERLDKLAAKLNRGEHPTTPSHAHLVAHAKASSPDSAAALQSLIDKATGETIERAKLIAEDVAHGRIQIDAVAEAIDDLHTDATRLALKGDKE